MNKEGFSHSNEAEYPIVHSEEGDSIHFSLESGSETLGKITATKTADGVYDVGGLFVNPANRGTGLGSALVLRLNAFLDASGSKARLVNTVQGEAAVIYERNGWKTGAYKSHGGYGAYEYTYTGKKEAV